MYFTICVCLAKSLAQIRVKILHRRSEILETAMEIVADSWIKLQKNKLKLVVLNVYLALPLMVMSIRIRAALFSELAENPVTNTPFLPFLDLIP